MPGRCVFVIDHHPAVRDGLTRFLAVHGYDVVVHPGTADAVALIRRLQPAVTLVDLHLDAPLNGLAVARAARRPDDAGDGLIVWSFDRAVEHHVAALDLPGVPYAPTMSTRRSCGKLVPGLPASRKTACSACAQL